MSAKHGDSLSGVDVSFLAIEESGDPAHMGLAMIFEGEPPPQDEFLALLESRLHLVPRYRQVVSTPIKGLGRARWIDDNSFHLPYHVRRTALASPGGHDEFRRLVGRIYSQLLDRTRPLWEIWMVEGLVHQGRPAFAVINKTHHAMVDGVSGMDLIATLLDVKPETHPIPAPPPWRPAPRPTEVDELANTAAWWTHELVHAAGTFATQPRKLFENIHRVVDVSKTFTSAPETTFNVPSGPHRRVEWTRAPLGLFKSVRQSLGGTLNDVVLAVMGGALGTYLRHQGMRTDDLVLKIAVPVSVRDPGAGMDERANAISMMACPIPVSDKISPANRLKIVTREMNSVKDSGLALGASTIMELSNFAPPALMAAAMRGGVGGRPLNLVVTNIPGPQQTLFLRGRPMVDFIPVGFCTSGFALTTVIISYDGQLYAGWIGDRDSVHDLDVLADGFQQALADLAAAADKAKVSSPSTGSIRRKKASVQPRRSQAKKPNGNTKTKRRTVSK